jgi:hypothetical protein
MLVDDGEKVPAGSDCDRRAISKTPAGEFVPLKELVFITALRPRIAVVRCEDVVIVGGNRRPGGCVSSQARHVYVPARPWSS